MITIIFTILNALYDNGKRFIDHTSRYIYRGLFIILVSYFLPGYFFTNLALNTAIFYMLFDYTLNYLEGRKWNYIGGTANHDLFWRDHGGWKSQLAFKIVFLLITISLKIYLP